MIKGIFEFTLAKEQVMFYPIVGEPMCFPTLDDFINYDFGCHGAAIFTSLSEINAIYVYLKEGNLNDRYNFSLVYVNQNIKKIIGLRITKKNLNQSHSFKMFYDVKYKLGSDELKLEDALKLIEETDFKRFNSGYTGKLRKEIKLDEKICRTTINNLPSMAPNIYTKTLSECENVQCWDITSAYPYLLTQPLPHYSRKITYTPGMKFDFEHCTYYGGIEITNIKAKNSYFPLTLVGKNNKQITIESQGENIISQGVRLVSADRVIIYGFIPYLVKILKRNYNYEKYRISKDLIEFELKIDWNLRETILNYFEAKQEKKRNGINYSGEKILLNRLYGFLITTGSNMPAHYGQYVVSKQRLIIDDMIHEIGLKDVVHCHTDSIKFVGDHEAAIQKYNSQIKFKELGRFVLEDTYQKCCYFSHITGKYIDKDGKIGFKHGGIDKIGIGHLYKMKYEDITIDTKYYLVRSYFYLKGEGYFPNFTINTFNKSVDDGDDD